MRLLLIGRGGQLGRELERALPALGDITAVDRRTIDLTRLDAIQTVVRVVGPTVIVNAAAYTDVDRAESEPEIAHMVNARAPGLLAEEAAGIGALFVHFSTDYVFDGAKRTPYGEDDPTGPLNVYGQTKLAGEQAITAAGGQHLILRTSWVYAPHGRNFLRTMLRLAAERDVLRIVADQHGAPTSAAWLADTTAAVIGQVLQQGGSPAAVYHATCSGKTSWYGFARAIFERLQLDRPPELEPLPSEAYPTPARRPAFSVLSNERLLTDFSVVRQNWEAALDGVIRVMRSERTGIDSA